MKKKGFTLIELLAVIVILAIIALIAVPIILNVIEKSKKGAAESSALGYVDAVEKHVALSIIDTTKITLEDGIYTIQELRDNYKLQIKGAHPTDNSWVMIDNKNVKACSLKIDKYVINCNGNSNVSIVNQEDVTKKPSGRTPPSIVISNKSATANSITVDFTIDNDDIIIASEVCKAGTKKGKYDIEGEIENGKCTFKNLEKGTLYFFEFIIKNEFGLMTIKDDSFETLKEFNVTFDANGGSISNPSKTVIYSEKYGTLPTPSHPSGYVFGGWYTDKNWTTKIDANTEVTALEDHSLVAQWKYLTSIQGISYNNSNNYAANSTFNKTYTNIDYVYLACGLGWQGQNSTANCYVYDQTTGSYVYNATARSGNEQPTRCYAYLDPTHTYQIYAHAESWYYSNWSQYNVAWYSGDIQRYVIK